MTHDELYDHMEEINNYYLKIILDLMLRERFNWSNMDLFRMSLADIHRKNRLQWNYKTCLGYFCTSVTAIDCQICEPESLLHVAVEIQNIDMIRILVEEGFYVNALYKHRVTKSYSDPGMTPLHLSAMYNFMNETKALIDLGASKEIRCSSLYFGTKGTPADWAATFGHFEMARFLNPSFNHKQIFMVAHHFYFALSGAMSDNNITKVIQLFEILRFDRVEKPNMTRTIWNNFCFWTNHGYVNIRIWYIILLWGSLSPNSKYVNPAFNASYNILHSAVRHKALVRLLLDLGGNPITKGTNINRNGNSLDWLNACHLETPVKKYVDIRRMLQIRSLELSHNSLFSLCKVSIRKNLRFKNITTREMNISISKLPIPILLQEQLQFKSLS